MYGFMPYNRDREKGPLWTETVMAEAYARDTRQKAERLEARVTREQKELFKRAAALQGRSLTDFIVNSVQEAAVRVLQEREILTLSARDQEAFVSALLNPPEPGQRLQAAARRYKETAGT
jgi:uncharacterized protein (DUF1778 family)